MRTTLNDPDDRNTRRSDERPIIRIAREAAGGKAAGERPRAYLWVFGPSRRPDRKWLENLSLH